MHERLDTGHQGRVVGAAGFENRAHEIIVKTVQGKGLSDLREPVANKPLRLDIPLREPTGLDPERLIVFQETRVSLC